MYECSCFTGSQPLSIKQTKSSNAQKSHIHGGYGEHRAHTFVESTDAQKDSRHYCRSRTGLIYICFDLRLQAIQCRTFVVSNDWPLKNRPVLIDPAACLSSTRSSWSKIKLLESKDNQCQEEFSGQSLTHQLLVSPFSQHVKQKKLLCNLCRHAFKLPICNKVSIAPSMW